MKFATRAIRSGKDIDAVTGAVVPSICQSTTFAFHGIEDRRTHEYSRSGNPTRDALEDCIADLEGGAGGLAFASGSAATVAVLSLLRPGDHIVATQDIYGGTYRIFEGIAAPSQIEVTYADARDPASLGRAARPSTRLFWVESPTNPLLQIVDVAAVAEEAHRAGALLVVDNTFASPFLQRPLSLGADLVLHSTTKYLGGHSDVVGGALVSKTKDLHERLYAYQNAAGAVPGPFDAWLVLRGIKTLAVRMRAHEGNALAVARFLEAHPLVESVVYPGLPSHPGHELAKRQMDGFGGMVSFRLPGGRAQADAFARALELFAFAESLGGVESLACHPATMTHATMSAEQREARGITEGTIRLSVGIEDAEDIVADLERGLVAAAAA